MEYIEIKEQIKQKLPVARDLGDSENLLELGLSSLTIMRLVNQWRKQGVKVSFGSLMENPTLEGWWALIQRSMKKKAGKKRAQESKITPEKDMKQPFPLTDVQYAYWVGRDEEVLKCQDVSLKDDFFSSGGNSLKAITLANRIKEKYIIERVQ